MIIDYSVLSVAVWNVINLAPSPCSLSCSGLRFPGLTAAKITGACNVRLAANPHAKLTRKTEPSKVCRLIVCFTLHLLHHLHWLRTGRWSLYLGSHSRSLCCLCARPPSLLSYAWNKGGHQSNSESYVFTVQADNRRTSYSDLGSSNVTVQCVAIVLFSMICSNSGCNLLGLAITT